MGLLRTLFGVSSRRSSRRKPSKAQQAERRRKAIARSEAKLKRERERAEKKRQAEQKRRERERAAAQRYRDAQQEKRLRGQDKIARRLGLPTWRNPRGKRRRNPADAADLERARRMSREFHGSDDEVIELEDGERRLPKYVVALGSVPELSYEPSARYSKRAGWKWVHESGDRGDGKPRARQRPVLAADPATGRPVIVPMRSPVRMNFKRGLVG